MKSLDGMILGMEKPVPEQNQPVEPFERQELPKIVTKLLMDYEIEVLLNNINGHFGATSTDQTQETIPESSSPEAQ